MHEYTRHYLPGNQILKMAAYSIVLYDRACLSDESAGVPVAEVNAWEISATRKLLVL